ncbi:T9SS-dependent choice-of-anchor J family protein [Mangrovimonas cancribranchiae]|uniref:Choice-of-anchor J domain-containing protein n=1 Tax=Mangrovimonas cancribranchiae TaxID=3080055 RepID=A0AAU6P3C1_9FLAO
MKHMYFLLLALCITTMGFGQSTIYTQDFETDLNGYSHTPSQTPSTDSGDRYFHRAEPSDDAIYESGGDGPYTNVTGSWLFVGSNPNSINSSSPGILSFDPIDVTNYTDLELSADFGAVPEDWDSSDDLSVEYSWDNSNWNILYNFQAGGDGTNEPIFLNGNAIGGNNTLNGVTLTYSLQTIVSDNFTGAGSTLYLRLVCDSNANYEAFGVDNFTLKGTLITTDTQVQFTSASASVSEGVGTYDLEFAITNEDATNATAFDVVLTTGDNTDIDGYTTQTVTFPAGASANETLTITITDDAVFEGDETLTFSIQNVTGGNNAAVGIQSTFDLTITDNEAAPALSLPYSIDATSTDPFSDNWTQYDNDEVNSWDYNSGSGVEMNAYSNDCNAEDWLITPAFDLSGSSNELLSFTLAEQYSGTDIIVQYSTDYDGTSDPNTATWSTITTITSGNGGVTEDHTGLQGVNATNVYLAFLYEDNTSCSSWTLENFTLEEGEPAPDNNLCSNAIAITANTGVTNGTLANATFTSPFENVDVWYSITPTYDETYTITLSNFSGDADLYLYSSSCPTPDSHIADSATLSSTETIEYVLTTGTTYYIQVEAYNSAAEDTFDIEVTAPELTSCITPSSQPSNLQTNTITHNSISGNFTSTTADAYLVVISESATLGATPNDETTYNTNDVLGNGIVVQADANNTFTATDLDAETTYYVFVFAYNEACLDGPLYNTTSPLNGTATTTAAPNTPTPGDLFITEVSDASDYNNEFIEIFNFSDTTIDLSTTKLVMLYDGTVWDLSDFSPTTIPPRNFLIISRGETQTSFETEFGTLNNNTLFMEGTSSMFFGTGRRWQLFEGGTVDTADGILLDDTNTTVAVAGERDYQNIFSGDFINTPDIEANPGELDYLIYFDNDTWLNNNHARSSTSDSDAYILSDYTCTENVHINNLEIENDVTVTITEGIYVIANDVTNNGEIILNSSSTTYSSLLANSVSGSGTTTYNRYTNQMGSGTTGGNDLIAAPVSGQLVPAFQVANSNLATSGTTIALAPFNNNSGAYENYDTALNATTALVSGTGYRAATTDGSALTFTGTVETGNVPIDITVGTDATFGQWNLIGNPYPSYLDMETFLNYEVSTGITNLDLMLTNSGIYGYDGNASDGWTVITLANATGELMAPGQGFFVAANGDHVLDYDMTFTPSMRAHDGGDDFIMGRSNNNLTFLKLLASTTSNQYRTEFYFNDHATTGLDAGYDAQLWGGTVPSFALYSQLVTENQGTPIALQALNNDAVNYVTIPLGVVANAGEQLTFSILESQLPANTNVYIEDRSNNTFTLLNTTHYSITPNAALQGTGRFYIHFENQALSIQNHETHDAFNIYSSPHNKTITIEGTVNPNSQVSVYDMQGRLVYNTPLETGTTNNTISLKQLSQGIYIVKVGNTNASQTKKIALN